MLTFYQIFKILMKIMYKIDIDTGVAVVFIGCEVYLFLEEDPSKKVLI